MYSQYNTTEGEYSDVSLGTDVTTENETKKSKPVFDDEEDDDEIEEKIIKKKPAKKSLKAKKITKK